MVDGEGRESELGSAFPIRLQAHATGECLVSSTSQVVREPLARRDCTVPVPLDVVMPVASYQVVVRALETLLNDVEPAALGHDRTLMLPSLSMSPQVLPSHFNQAAGRTGYSVVCLS